MDKHKVSDRPAGRWKQNILVFCLFLGALLCCCPMRVRAEEASVAFGAESYTGETGGQFEVEVHIRAESRIGAYYVEVEYDKGRMEYTGGAEGEEDGIITLLGTGFREEVQYTLSFRLLSGGEGGLRIRHADVQMAEESGGGNFKVASLGSAPVHIGGEDTVGGSFFDEPPEENDNSSLFGIDTDVPLICAIQAGMGNVFYVVDHGLYVPKDAAWKYKKVPGNYGGQQVTFLTNEAGTVQMLYLMDDIGIFYPYAYYEDDGLLYPCHETYRDGKTFYYMSPAVCSEWPEELTLEVVAEEFVVYGMDLDGNGGFYHFDKDLNLVEWNANKFKSAAIDQTTKLIIIFSAADVIIIAVCAASLLSVRRQKRRRHTGGQTRRTSVSHGGGQRTGSKVGVGGGTAGEVAFGGAGAGRAGAVGRGAGSGTAADRRTASGGAGSAGRGTVPGEAASGAADAGRAGGRRTVSGAADVAGRGTVSGGAASGAAGAVQTASDGADLGKAGSGRNASGRKTSREAVPSAGGSLDGGMASGAATGRAGAGETASGAAAGRAGAGELASGAAAGRAGAGQKVSGAAGAGQTASGAAVLGADGSEGRALDAAASGAAVLETAGQQGTGAALQDGSETGYDVEDGYADADYEEELEYVEPPVISVQDVTMVFHISTSNASGIKEYFVQWVKHQVRFRELTVLDRVKFDVFRGEVVGIIGSNGSGKSTLLRIISGALNPTGGRVSVDRRKVQLLTLGTGFDAELSARENIYLNGAIIGYSRQFLDEHVEEIAEFAELQDFMEEKVKNFSSGMVSRLGFAIATAGDAAEILILDEILSVGDQFFQKKSLKRIKEMIHGGSTVIMVSHSMGTILDNCTKAVWIEKGVLQMVGEPKTVCKAYQQRSVSA